MKFLLRRQILFSASTFLLGAALLGCASDSNQNALAANPYANSASMPMTPMPTSTAIPVSQLIHKGTLEIESHTPFPDNMQAELDLAYYLKAAPHIKFFRVSWSFAAANGAIYNVTSYDRTTKKLRSYCSGWKGENSVDSGYHLIYSGVTDEILIKMAQKDSQTISGAGDGFANLKNYGCKVTNLK